MLAVMHACTEASQLSQASPNYSSAQALAEAGTVISTHRKQWPSLQLIDNQFCALAST